MAFAVSVSCAGSGAAKDSGKSAVTMISDADFRTKIYDYVKNPNKWVFAGTKPAVVDFFADWCGPCRQIGPYLQALAAEYGDRVAFYKINIDDNQQTASFFGITSIPMVFVIPVNGDPVPILGAQPKDNYKAAIENALKSK